MNKINIKQVGESIGIIVSVFFLVVYLIYMFGNILNNSSETSNKTSNETSYVPWDEKTYYVAKFPNHNAASLKVDGYMHESESCCRKVADYFDADVIQITPKDKAGTNEYGQTVYYKDAFSYCRLCD